MSIFPGRYENQNVIVFLFCERKLKGSDIFVLTLVILIKGKMKFTPVSDVLPDVIQHDSWLKVPGA